MSEHAPHPSSQATWQPGLGALGEAFVTFLNPVPLTQPHWIAHSPAAAAWLGLDEAWLAQDDALKLFSGNGLGPACTAATSSACGPASWETDAH